MKNENHFFIHDKPPQIRNFKYWIKKLLLPLYTIYYTRLLKKTSKPTESKKHYLAICGIFKNESAYLKEWIEFHLLIGVDHFYLYNNFSDDSYVQVLDEYVKSGIVDLIDWPHFPGQFSSYEDCYKRFRHECNWISFLDIDEFICPIYDTSIKEWLKQFELFPSILLYWKMFGTSGIENRNIDNLVIEDFTSCWPKLDDVSKVIFNTKFEVADFNNHHFLHARILHKGKQIIIPPINEFKIFIKHGFHPVGKHKLKDITVQLNHYWSKSYGEYVEKKLARGDVNNHLRNIDYLILHEHHNKDKDFKILRFLIELKLRMKKV